MIKLDDITKTTITITLRDNINLEEILTNGEVDEEIQKFLVENDDHELRELAAKHGFRSDVLVNDKNWRVRVAVAKQGYCLDVLVNDENKQVREVAQQGGALDILIFDTVPAIRKEVEQQQLNYQE